MSYRSKNPWMDHDRPWEEFKWDVAHPAEFFKDGWAGMMGRNPKLSREERMVGFAMVGMGLVQIIFALVILLFL